jgi:tRNA U55 pseudouridine synthase TruB
LDRALKWENFEMQKRFCNILKIELIDYKYPTASFMALVSPGTYIRSIANDLWIELWTGWYVTELKRTKIWNLDLNSAQNLENFDKNRVLDIKKLFKWRKFVNCYQDKEQNCKELEPPFLSFEVITKINDW